MIYCNKIKILSLAMLSLALLLTSGLPAWAGPGFGVVVGNNGSVLDELEELRFADDDALRTAALLAPAMELEVLTRPDPETRELLGELMPVQAPTRENVIAALEGLVRRGREAAAGGGTPVLYFIFSGHGNYDQEGRGFLHLEDGRLTTRDLFHYLIQPTAGTCRVVLIIDACNAGFMVKAKGVGARRRARATTLRMEDYDHVGLILSSSSSGEVREWERFMGGIFSHQLRSALLGGADADQDGLITFDEVAGFLAAANQGVRNPQFKLTPYVRPPLGKPDEPVLDLGAYAHLGKLRLDRAERVQLFDDQLVNRFEMNVEQGTWPELNLPAGRYWLRAGGADYQVDLRDGELRLSSRLVPLEAAALRTKGADTYLSENLFQVPYGRSFAENYLAGPYRESMVFTREEPRPWYTNSLGWGLTGGALALGIAGSVFYLDAMSASDTAGKLEYSDQVDQLNDRIHRDNIFAGTFIGVGLGAALAATLVFTLDEQWDEHQVSPLPPVGLSPIPGGLMINAAFGLD